MSFGFLFFLPSTDTGTLDDYLPDNALLTLANEHMDRLDAAWARDIFSAEAVPDSAPAPIIDLAGWINHHADLGAHHLSASPAFRFLSISEFPVTPMSGVLHIEVPFGTAEDTGRHFQFKAAELGVCMVDDMGQIWVNPTGGDSGLRMRDSVDAVTTHVDHTSILAVLGEDVDRRRRADHGIPFVIIEVNGDDSMSPIAGIRYIQAALTGGGWVVEYRTSNRYYRLDREALDTVNAANDGNDAEALTYISRLLGEYALGEHDAFYSHHWEDASAELVL